MCDAARPAGGCNPEDTGRLSTNSLGYFLEGYTRYLISSPARGSSPPRSKQALYFCVGRAINQSFQNLPLQLRERYQNVQDPFLQYPFRIDLEIVYQGSTQGLPLSDLKTAGAVGAETALVPTPMRRIGSLSGSRRSFESSPWAAGVLADQLQPQPGRWVLTRRCSTESQRAKEAPARGIAFSPPAGIHLGFLSHGRTSRLLRSATSGS